MSWQKLKPTEVDWRASGEGSVRVITETPALLTQARLDLGRSREFGGGFGHLVLITVGGVRLDDECLLGVGDLLWVPAGESITIEASEEAELYELALAPGVGGSDIEVILSDRISWQQFEDPANRPTQPVQLLMEQDDLAVLRTRFVPEYSAGEHWHDFDTWYFITDGDMRFGHEGTYRSGEVRQVRGGYSYGPEEPGSQGVEFVLVSVGGPVALHWADLEPAPNGPL